MDKRYKINKMYQIKRANYLKMKNLMTKTHNKGLKTNKNKLPLHQTNSEYLSNLNKSILSLTFKITNLLFQILIYQIQQISKFFFTFIIFTHILYYTLTFYKQTYLDQLNYSIINILNKHNYNLSLTQLKLMRPQTALPTSKNNKKIYKNQQNGQFYILDEQGKQIQVNQVGQLIPKFVQNFSGFVNFHQRKSKSLKDLSLMYNQPKIHYYKKQAFINPKGSKFNGYAQFRYNLKGKYPENLDKDSFKQSVNQIQRQNKNKLNLVYENSSSSLMKNKNNLPIKVKKTVNKFQSFKNLRREVVQSFIYDVDQIPVKRKKQIFSSEIKQRKNFEKSIIMEAGQEYQKQIKSSKSALTFDTNDQTNNFFNHSNKESTHCSNRKQIKGKSYFQQSLQNIQRTAFDTNLFSKKKQYNRMQYENTNDSAKQYFKTPSVHSHCYKRICQINKQIPKRRYMKVQTQQTVIGLDFYVKDLQEHAIQTNLTKELGQRLKFCQEATDQGSQNGKYIQKITKISRRNKTYKNLIKQ